MQRPIHSHKPLILGLLVLAVTLACTVVLTATETPPPPQAPTATLTFTPTYTPIVLGPPSTPRALRVVLQRLEVDFLGQDGHRLIGSGCPGSETIGSVDNYHFLVRGVDLDRPVQRVLVAGDNSTLTWEWRCTISWGLLARDLGEGTWEVFIAPSEPTEIYTLIFFYDDLSMALGMVKVPGPY